MCRKSKRSKEIAKNKKERQLQREAMSHVYVLSYQYMNTAVPVIYGICQLMKTSEKLVVDK